MPTQPRILRTTPDGPVTELDQREPEPVVAVLRWAGRPMHVVPAHKLAWAEGRSPAVLVRWAWDEGGVVREDWLRGIDVLDHWPGVEEWERLGRVRSYES